MQLCSRNFSQSWHRAPALISRMRFLLPPAARHHTPNQLAAHAARGGATVVGLATGAEGRASVPSRPPAATAARTATSPAPSSRTPPCARPTGGRCDVAITPATQSRACQPSLVAPRPPGAHRFELRPDDSPCRRGSGQRGPPRWVRIPSAAHPAEQNGSGCRVPCGRGAASRPTLFQRPSWSRPKKTFVAVRIDHQFWGISGTVFRFRGD